MGRSGLICLGVALLLLSGWGLNAAAPVAVAGSGAPERVIVLPDKPSPAERYAAEELSEYLTKVTGRKLAIVDRTAADRPAIRLIYDPALGPESWKFQCLNGEPVIAGGRPRGILYGVYDFLEKYAGVRWLDENTESVPSRSAVTVPADWNVQGTPAFAYRQIYDFARATGEKHYRFRTRSRLNVYSEPADPARYGFIERTGAPGGCHTCFAYSEGFPDDWFSLDAGGKRQKAISGVGPGNVCFSNPEVRKSFAAKLRKYIEADRAEAARDGKMPPHYYDISVNDNADSCHCPECRKLAEKYGESGLFVDFINAIANDIKTDYPDITIISLAYGCALEPPRGIKTADNVLMRVGQLGPELRMDAPRDTLRRLSTPLNRPSLEALQGWSRQAGQLGTWDYWILYTEPFASPHTSAPMLKENLSTYRDLGFKFVFGEAENYWVSYTAMLLQSFVDLRNYLAAKLMVDPDQDEAKLVDEFMQGFYGPAASEMKEYYEYLARRQDEETNWLGVVHPKRRKFLDAAFFTKVNGLLAEAEKKAADQPQYLANVRQERIMVDEAVLNMRDQLVAAGFAADPVPELLKRLERDYTAAAAKYYPDPAERAKVIADKVEALKMLAVKPPLPAELAARRVFDYYWTKAAEGDYNRVNADPEAVTGFAADPNNFMKRSDFHTRPAAFGVYDKLDKKDLLSFQLPHNQLPADEKYHWVRIGRLRPTAGAILWLHWTWQVSMPLGDMFDPIAPHRQYDVYVHFKAQGPSYVKGSTKPDALLIDRVICAEYVDDTVTPPSDFGDPEFLSRTVRLPLPPEFAGRKPVLDWYACAAVDSDNSRVSAEPGAPSGFAFEPKNTINSNDFHQRPPSFGVYDLDGKKDLLSVSVPRNAVAKDGQYHWFKVGCTRLVPNGVLWMHWSWNVGLPLGKFFRADRPDREYDIYVSYKVTGPSYGAPGKDAMFIDRVLMFEAENNKR